MSTKLSITVITILILIGIAISIAVYPHLPEQVASHWNANDQVNGYMSRFWGVALMPLITIGMALLFLAIPSIDPLKENIAKFRDTFNAFIVLAVAFMLYMHILTLVYNLGHTFRISLAMIPGLGLIFVFAGVMMSKAKRNYFIGIRTPWTLANETVWDETHKLGSKLFIGAGILSMFSLLLGENGFWLMMTLIMGAALIPVVYSYILFVRITDKQ
ncbi:MAG: SdpI family protein [Chloroflexi bacterium]|nr:SdpI family protein [Chloroflexota bacterium]